jgi:peptide deformylase
VTPAIERLAEDMLETMYDAPGIGLAAPQIGVLSPSVRYGLRERGGGSSRADGSVKSGNHRGL